MSATNDDRDSYLCAACDDRDEYSTEFTWKDKEGWPGNQQTLVCDYCGSDRLYICRPALVAP
jgi:hypothetical protein